MHMCMRMYLHSLVHKTRECRLQNGKINPKVFYVGLIIDLIVSCIGPKVHYETNCISDSLSM